MSQTIPPASILQAGAVLLIDALPRCRYNDDITGLPTGPFTAFTHSRAARNQDLGSL